MDEALEPVDDRCAEIRLLMLASGDRDLRELEARRVEQHVDDCTSCQRLLGDGDAGGIPETCVPPTDDEWRSMRQAIWEELDLPASEPMEPVTSVPTSSWWKPLLPLTAALFIIWLMVRDHEPTATVDPVAVGDFLAVEVSELPDDQSFDVYMGAEDDGVLVIISSG